MVGVWFIKLTYVNKKVSIKKVACPLFHHSLILPILADLPSEFLMFFNFFNVESSLDCCNIGKNRNYRQNCDYCWIKDVEKRAYHRTKEKKKQSFSSLHYPYLAFYS